MTVTTLKIAKPASKAPKAKGQSKAMAKRMRRQSYAAMGIISIGAALTVLSVTHLASGIEIVTQCKSWEAKLMAGIIDLGLILTELSLLFCSSDKLFKAIKTKATCVIVGTLTGSAIMNAFAFSSHAQGWMIIPGVLLGFAIPAMIFLITKIGAAMYIDGDSKK